LLLEPNLDKGYQVLTIGRLVDEAFLLLVAGSDTTVYCIACATYYLLTHKEPLVKLKEELQTLPRTDNGRLELTNVTGLPYLVFPFLSWSENYITDRAKRRRSSKRAYASRRASPASYHGSYRLKVRW
jgi:hypothetical protein